MKSLRSLILAAAFTMIAAATAFSQPAGLPSFDRKSNFDMQHYVLRVSFDRDARTIAGDTTVVLKPLNEGFTSFELDAVGMTFQSVKIEQSGTDLKYSNINNLIKITMDRSYGPADTISVRLKYTAKPQKGIYFVNAETDPRRVVHSDQIWTQGEADEARHWFPSFDFPSDKATTEEYITVERDETVIGNGEFFGKTDTAEGKSTWHFKMPVPHSTYLVSFVVGKYVRIDDTAGTVPLAYYVYPGKEDTGRRAFSQTSKMIPVFEGVTGVKFPYNKYDQTIVASFQFGGMENITATTMADTEIFFGDFEFGKDVVTDLVSHELAHSWFGDLVTCRSWAELWLNEGFATYMEAVYREKTNGREDYMRKVRFDAATFLADDSITKRRHGLYNLRAADPAKLFDNASVTYNKGGVVLHMLREQVGTEVFWKAVNNYLNRHKFGSVISTDLKAAMEQASGQDLTWFFDQWVYSSGAPSLSVRPVYSTKAKTLALTVTQTQKPDAIVPAVFRLPLDVSVKMTAGYEKKSIDIHQRIEKFSVKMRAKPQSIEFDPDGKVLAMNVKILPILIVR